jgi:nucleoside-diphosphate-sugar epimerase
MHHVVFGTGQIGHHVVSQLVARGDDVIGVNHDGQGSIPGARIVRGDATDPDFTRRIAVGADSVFFCLNAPNYERWATEFPPLQRAVLAGAEASGARLVVLDNLYAYGPPNGRDLVETMANRPTSEKSRTRAAMTDELLAAHHDGRVEVAIGRASDYFGPGARRSALGDTVFGSALTGRRAQVMGDIDQRHSYSFTPDVAAGLVTLATEPGAVGEIWHLPVAPASTTRRIIDHVYARAGHRPKAFAAGRVALRSIGVIQPVMREYLHTLYQFDARWVVDDSKFRAAFGDRATPLDDALDTTLAWFRQAAPAPVPATR